MPYIRRTPSATSVVLPLTGGLNGQVRGGVTFTRASDQWYQDDAGVWQKVTANIPAFNSKGILLEPASTNKCTCYGVPNNAVGTQSFHNGAVFVQNHTNMTLSGDVAATLTTVDDAPALAAAGLGSIAASGKVYEVVNPGATTALVDIEGVTNASAHSISIFGRRLSGVDASNYFIALTDSAGIAPLNSAAYVRVQFANTPINHANQKLRIRIPAGNTCRFILPQLEELPFCTTPVVTQGAAASRVLTVMTLTTAGNLKSNDFTIYLDTTIMAVAPGSYPQILIASDGNVGAAQNQIAIQADAGQAQIYAQRMTTGPVYNASGGSAIVLGASKRLAAVFSSSGVRFAANGVSRLPHANTTAIPFIGNISIPAGNAVKYLKNLRIYRKPLSDARLIAMTT